MIASFARLSEWADDLFATSGKVVSMLMKRARDTKAYQRWEPFHQQSGSWWRWEGLDGVGPPRPIIAPVGSHPA